ncbi:LysR substrate-binding domain-containing protein [Mycobacterium avium]|uniref:LysR substrate-binding domain-containing protein n=1 Tax=Mycobacterium avium TaxID=1764 RepID=UPI0007A0042E|nr:LysR substrate-binding domain-containing protein [Mycobacterium avium]
MELRHLRYFRAVAEELHFGKAAERLHIAQPPLSQQIRQLENELGVELFTRSTRKVELTPAGQAYIKQVVAVLELVDIASKHAQRVAAGIDGQLAIGCVGSATYSVLPQLVRALRKELPYVDVSVRGEMLAPAQVAALLAGEIQIALLRPPVQHPDIKTVALRRDRLIAVLPEDHRLARRKQLNVNDLRDEDFIAHSGKGLSVMGGVIAAVCADAGFVPRIRHEVQETSTLITLVAAGLGVAIVPAPTSALDIGGLRHVRLGPASLGVDLIAAWRGDATSPVLERALSVLRRMIRGTDLHGVPA